MRYFYLFFIVVILMSFVISGVSAEAQEDTEQILQEIKINIDGSKSIVERTKEYPKKIEKSMTNIKDWKELSEGEYKKKIKNTLKLMNASISDIDELNSKLGNLAGLIDRFEAGGGDTENQNYAAAISSLETQIATQEKYMKIIQKKFTDNEFFKAAVRKNALLKNRLDEIKIKQADALKLKNETGMSKAGKLIRLTKIYAEVQDQQASIVRSVFKTAVIGISQQKGIYDAVKDAFGKPEGLEDMVSGMIAGGYRWDNIITDLVGLLDGVGGEIFGFDDGLINAMDKANAWLIKGSPGHGIEMGPTACHDGIDNDGDGLVDCNDPDCRGICD